MIEILKGFPDNILAMEGVGKITADDYRNVLIPEAERRLAKHQAIKLFCILGSRFDGLTPGAAWADLKLGVSHWNQFEQMAVVTDTSWIRDSLLLFGPIYHHPIKVFPTTELDVAKKWIAEKEPAKS